MFVSFTHLSAGFLLFSCWLVWLFKNCRYKSFVSCMSLRTEVNIMVGFEVRQSWNWLLVPPHSLCNLEQVIKFLFNTQASSSRNEDDKSNHIHRSLWELRSYAELNGVWLVGAHQLLVLSSWYTCWCGVCFFSFLDKCLENNVFIHLFIPSTWDC